VSGGSEYPTLTPHDDDSYSSKQSNQKKVTFIDERVGTLTGGLEPKEITLAYHDSDFEVIDRVDNPEAVTRGYSQGMDEPNHGLVRTDNSKVLM